MHVPDLFERVRFRVGPQNQTPGRGTERHALPREVAEWEPSGALFAGPAGTEAIAAVVREAPRHLTPGGLLAIEVGRGQDRDARRLIEEAAGLEFLADYSDLSGIARGVLALAPDQEE